MPIRILLADDHVLFRTGLGALLNREQDFEVCKETGTSYDTVREAAKEEIDLVVLDLSMPGGLNGVEIARSILHKRPKLPIVVLTMHDDDYYLRELLQVEVKAFVLKKSTDLEVFQAIRSAFRGDFYVDTSMAAHLIEPYIGRSVQEANKPLDILTKREQEICKLLAFGQTNAEIAKKLDISFRTAENHRANIMTKLGLKSRADLVRFSIDNNLMKLN